MLFVLVWEHQGGGRVKRPERPEQNMIDLFIIELPLLMAPVSWFCLHLFWGDLQCVTAVDLISLFTSDEDEQEIEPSAIGSKSCVTRFIRRMLAIVSLTLHQLLLENRFVLPTQLFFFINWICVLIWFDLGCIVLEFWLWWRVPFKTPNLPAIFWW